MSETGLAVAAHERGLDRGARQEPGRELVDHLLAGPAAAARRGTGGRRRGGAIAGGLAARHGGLALAVVVVVAIVVVAIVVVVGRELLGAARQLEREDVPHDRERGLAHRVLEP